MISFSTRSVWVFLFGLLAWVLVGMYVMPMIADTSSDALATNSFWVQSYEWDDDTMQKWLYVNSEKYDPSCHNIEKLTSCLSSGAPYASCAQTSMDARCLAFVDELSQMHSAGGAVSNIAEAAVNSYSNATKDTVSWFIHGSGKREAPTQVVNSQQAAGGSCDLSFDYRIGNHNYTESCVQERCCSFCMSKTDKGQEYCENNCRSTSCSAAFDKVGKEMYQVK